MKTISDNIDISDIFRTIVEESPTPIALYTGPDMKIAMANNAMMVAYGKDESIIGKPFLQAIPEFKNQPFFEILQNVYKTGIAYYTETSRTEVIINGILQTFYYSFDYKPLKNKYGKVWGIINTATDITRQVLDKKAMDRAEEMLRLAVDSAELGTWFLDRDTQQFTVSNRTKQLYGYNLNENFSIEKVLAQIPEIHRKEVVTAINAAIHNAKPYDIEYPIIGYHDQHLRWVRVTGKLYESEERKSPFLAGTVLDITERKQEELRKNDFIGMVSHELKTPLTSLTGYIQIMLEKANKEQDPFITYALEKSNLQLKKMSSIINGFINVARLESGKIFLIRQNFNLDNLVDEVIEETRLVVSDHPIIYERGNQLTVYGDLEKLRSVISNLLSNAVKYSAKGKPIEVKCKAVDNMAQVSIRDQGIGINSQDIEKLFERYYRVESKHTQYISGFGIGLYLSAEIIQQHQGKIWVQSAPGEGSTFFFNLPLLSGKQA